MKSPRVAQPATAARLSADRGSGHSLARNATASLNQFRTVARLLLLVLTSLRAGAAAPPSPASKAIDPSDAFYDPATVQTIHLAIAPADLERMQRALPRRITVPGTFRWNDQTLGPVGIRYKGNSSSPPQWPFKRSYLVSFGEFTDGRRFLGLRHVALDNGIQFGGLFGEALTTGILRGVGVKASRCNHARVYLNGKPAGVYVNVERLDRSFLERHFDSPGGPLFKVDEGGPGADLTYLGDDPEAYRKTFEPQAGTGPEAFQDLVEFTRTLHRPDLSRAELEAALDVGAFLKTTAVLLLAGAFDQYTGWSPHNYYLYRNPADHRWTYLPWDLDVGFADRAFGKIPVLEGWHAAWPAPVPGRPLMERIVADPVLLDRYRRLAREILENWFHPEALVPRLRTLYARIQPALAEDPHPLRRATVPSDTGIEDALASMERFIRDRYALARSQLESPGNRPAPTPVPPDAGPGREGPAPGPPSADAPTDLRVVRVDSESVELRWVDHAEGEVAHVVQRCEGGDDANFANAIGQGGPHVTGAVDRQVRPGATYRYRVYAVHPTPRGPRGTGVSNVVTVTLPARSTPE